jgi:hypothetical protein
MCALAGGFPSVQVCGSHVVGEAVESAGSLRDIPESLVHLKSPDECSQSPGWVAITLLRYGSNLMNSGLPASNSGPAALTTGRDQVLPEDDSSRRPATAHSRRSGNNMVHLSTLSEPNQPFDTMALTNDDRLRPKVKSSQFSP